MIAVADQEESCCGNKPSTSNQKLTCCDDLASSLAFNDRFLGNYSKQHSKTQP
jgi:hypothetical protein